MNEQPTPVLRAQGITRTYHQGDTAVEVLHGVDIELARGERVAIVGRSGSGKSTLLHVLAGLDTADAGEVYVGDTNMTTASANAKAQLRGAHMGFVYQNHHLLPEFTALENVAMPVRINGASRADAEEQARDLLRDVGLADRVHHFPSALSGGERQRVAVARALAGNPSVVLADEPTGNLDRENAQQVMNLVNSLSVERGTAFLVVTHDVSMLDAFDRVLNLVDGRLSDYSASDRAD
jgi:lipoprotein-releasing system ATP-binding protein